MEIIKLDTVFCLRLENRNYNYAVDFSKQSAKVKVNVRVYSKGSRKYETRKFVNPNFAIHHISIIPTETSESIADYGLYINDEFIGSVTGYFPSFLDLYDEDDRTFTISVQNYIKTTLQIV